MKDIEYGGYVIPEGWQVSENLEASIFSAILSSLPMLLIIPPTDTLLIHVQIFWVASMTHMDDSIFPEP